MESLRWIIAQEGSRQSYAVPIAFSRMGTLRLFYTDIWCRWGRSILAQGPKGARALAGRFNSELPPDRVVSFSPEGILARAIQHFRRTRMNSEALGREYCRFGRWFATRVRARLENIEMDPKKDVFLGFDTNSLEVLEALKARRIFTVLDQVDPGTVHEDMLIEECERWPGWQKFPDRMPSSYIERRQQEWKLADAVLVNSEWSAHALARQGVPPGKIIVVPLAIDLSHQRPLPPVEARGTLKVLWIGNISVNKGVQYLVEAARLLQREDIEFILAGPMYISDKAIGAFPSNIKPLGWVPRSELAGVYRSAHVFVLPTISDGFAMTQLEAMAHGLPVVITPNCGRVVTDGLDGFIIPARDSRALADSLARLNANRALLRDMSIQALKTVQNFDLPSNARMIAEQTLAARERQSWAAARI